MDSRIKEAPVLSPAARRNVGVLISVSVVCLLVFLCFLSPQAAVLVACDYALLGIGLLLFAYTNRQSVRVWGVGSLMVAHVALIGFAAFYTARPSLGFFATPALLAGWWLTSYGLTRRIGTELRCIKCDYPHNDHPHCPECSADWTAWRSLARGERIKDIPCIALGVVCLVFWIGSSFGSATSLFLTPSMPKSALIQIAGAPGGNALHFAELDKRTLSGAERDTLATMLVDTRDRVGELDTSQERWLNEASTAGTIATTLVDRHLSGLYTLQLAAPANARVGVPTQIDVIISTKSHSFLSGREMHLWLDGLWLGESRVSEPDKSWLTMVEVHNYVDESGDPMIPPPHITFTPTTAGRQTVKAVYWLAWFTRPVPASRAVTVPPPGAIWSKRIELSTTIDVQP
jgi:hypothetical protein